jgi:hypothetical protein
MGEKSKSIGEKGEKIVENFLRLIGWNNPQPNRTLTCLHPVEHKSKSANNSRTTHGIDFFYANKSHLKINTLDNIVISVKFSASEYPKYPSTDSVFFKVVVTLRLNIKLHLLHRLRVPYLGLTLLGQPPHNF